jgi:serine/threonine-protein kinase RsbW
MVRSIVGILADTGQAAPDLTGMDELPDAMAESGRGLWLARATLDELDYVRVGDRNTWKLVRLRNADPARHSA